VLLQLLQTAVGDVFSGLFVGLRAPVVGGEVELEGVEGFAEGVESRDTGADDLGTDPVGGDSSDVISLVRENGGRHVDGSTEVL
jgi:hypothetical protein